MLKLRKALLDGRTINLIRYRPTDLSEHRFSFVYESSERRYRLSERYEGDLVQEEYHDLEVVEILIEWLLKLRFEANIWSKEDKGGEI